MTTRRTSSRRSTLTRAPTIREAHGKAASVPFVPYVWTPPPAWPPPWSPDAPEEPELLEYEQTE